MPRVSRVSVLQVGRVRVRPDNVAGTWRPMLWWTAFSRSWTPWLPVNVVVVEHDAGVLLVDTGQSPASLEPGYHPGGVLGWAYRRQAEFQVGPADRLSARLGELGLTLADVDTVVLTHLHQDHAGNIGLLPHARVLVSADELALLDEKQPAAHGVLPEHVAPPSVTFTPVRPVPLAVPAGPFTTGTDLYDDGTLVLLPTPGHSRGSQSLLVRRGRRRARPGGRGAGHRVGVTPTRHPGHRSRPAARRWGREPRAVECSGHGMRVTRTPVPWNPPAAGGFSDCPLWDAACPRAGSRTAPAPRFRRSDAVLVRSG